MSVELNRPAFVKDEHLKYLNFLRKSGAANMLGAVPYILHAYPDLTRSEAREVLTYWMQTFQGD